MVLLCQQLGLFGENLVAIDGSKFKAVNNRDRNFTSAKLKRRMEEIESSINRYLTALDEADQQEPSIAQPKATRLQEKIDKLKAQMKELQVIEIQLNESPDKQVSLTDPDARSMMTRGTGIVGYNVQTALARSKSSTVSHGAAHAIVQPTSVDAQRRRGSRVFLHIWAGSCRSLSRSAPVKFVQSFSSPMRIAGQRGWSNRVQFRTCRKKSSHEKNQHGKALIPLPPTGFASVFYVNPDVLQTILQPRRGRGIPGASAISQNERVGREMKRGCTAALRVVLNGLKLEAPGFIR